MADYFSTLTKEEIALNLKLLEQFSNKKEKKEEKKEEVKKIEVKKDDIIKKGQITKPPIIMHNFDLMPDNNYTTLFKKCYYKLNEFQQEIINECIPKGYGSLALPLGSGKTIISLCLSLFFCAEKKEPIIVVISKSLVTNWQTEIIKFFDDSLSFTILDTKQKLKDLKIKSIVTIITIDTLSGIYKAHLVNKLFIEAKFVTHMRGLGAYINYYKQMEEPLLSHSIGSGLLYSTQWGSFIVDEVQIYTNIDTDRCQSLGAIYAKHRWLLSGTLFDEPKVERIMGYYMILNAPEIPRNLPEVKTLISSRNFKGLQEHLITREKNLAFIPPKLNDIIIDHTLSNDEEKIYIMMKKILIVIKEKAKRAKLLHHREEYKVFSSYKLVMIMYLRQALICPLIPITSVILDASNAKKKSQIAKIIIDELNALGVDDYLQNINSVKSSRIKEVLKVLDKHDDEKCIVYSCFVSCLDIMAYFIKGRIVFRITSDMSATKRGEVISKFEKSKNGILLVTYDIGGQGLNLQFAAVVVLVDLYWNSGRTLQSIGRIFRYGQLAKEIFVYFFTANTGIEKIIYEKQNAKILILNELMTGSQTLSIPKIKMDDVIKMIEVEDNKVMLRTVNQNSYNKKI